jgi:hypothetical protein
MPAALPEQKLDDAFDILQIGFEIKMPFRIYYSLETRNFPLASLQADNYPHTNRPDLQWWLDLGSTNCMVGSPL